MVSEYYNFTAKIIIGGKKFNVLPEMIKICLKMETKTRELNPIPS